ncbi:hypothetical protein LCGC14_0384220 [marine sediment metagenome]|uniref:SF3 helicase domain-containing protein n=1 Tax=marine sediment metagenome TaxID=412755 RepID=A0A0F9WA95_9ZZZZ
MSERYTLDPESPLARLAALSPKTPEKDPPPTTRKKPNVQPRGSQSVDLGPVDVKKYLLHYGYDFNEKAGSGKIFYRLSQCLFDSNHGQNEGAIVQDEQGMLTYWCFHDNCNHTWAAARFEISGEESLAQFCKNYDPNYTSREKSPMDRGKTPDPDATPPVLPPSEIDPLVFYDDDGGKKKFRSQFLAEYLQSWFSPIVWDGMAFYKYEDGGVWKTTHLDLIGQDAVMAMGKYATNGAIEATIKLMEKRTMIHFDEFKHQSQYLNLKNGMLEIETGKVLPHDPKYYSRIQLDVSYDESAECPRWDKFLAQVFADDFDKITALQSYYGYCLLQDCRFQKCLFMVGSGANGKSVASDVLIAILGENNVSALPIEMMGKSFLVGQLKDKLVNVATEISTSQPTDAAVFKNAITGGLLAADRKHGDPYKFYPIAKHIFSMNEVPKIIDKSYGFQRRPIVITFNQRFEPGVEPYDPLLLDKLKLEATGIFMWMLDGLQSVLESGGLFIPDVVVRDTEKLITSMNPALQFIEDCCRVGEDYDVRPRDLYAGYLAWCKEGHNRPLSRNRFYGLILLYCPAVKPKQVGEDRHRVYAGIGLRADAIASPGTYE